MTYKKQRRLDSDEKQKLVCIITSNETRQDKWIILEDDKIFSYEKSARREFSNQIKLSTLNIYFMRKKKQNNSRWCNRRTEKKSFLHISTRHSVERLFMFPTEKLCITSWLFCIARFAIAQSKINEKTWWILL